MMNYLRKRFAPAISRSLARDRIIERHIEYASRIIWPWPEAKLIALVFILVILDFCSTFALLELSGRPDVYEGGRMAFWALQKGGFPLLLFIDLIAVGTMVTLALMLRTLHTKYGFSGYGRSAFVLLLGPYAIWTTAVVFNNVVLTFFWF